MILKTILSLEVEKNERFYQFLLPAGASYDDIYLVLQELRSEVLELAKKAEIKAKEEAEKIAKKEEESSKEDVKEVKKESKK